MKSTESGCACESWWWLPKKTFRQTESKAIALASEDLVQTISKENMGVKGNYRQFSSWLTCSGKVTITDGRPPTVVGLRMSDGLSGLTSEQQSDK
jgi:hypothetical protein